MFIIFNTHKYYEIRLNARITRNTYKDLLQTSATYTIFDQRSFRYVATRSFNIIREYIKQNENLIFFENNVNKLMIIFYRALSPKHNVTKHTTTEQQNI